MNTKKKTIQEEDKAAQKGNHIYYWIIAIGILLMVLAWLYFE